jgi:hypothetical protein
VKPALTTTLPEKTNLVVIVTVRTMRKARLRENEI